VDEYELPATAGLTPDKCLLRVGMYRPEDSSRLLVTDARGNAEPPDYVSLAGQQVSRCVGEPSTGGR
jgi:hypothetical protein